MSERYELVQRVGVHGPFDRLIARRPSAQGMARLALLDQLRGTPSGPRVDELGQAARLAAGASHPGLQRIYGAGRANGTAWIMTEIVAGERLGFLLERGRMAEWPAPPPHIAAELVAQAAEAIGALHARGTAHGRLDGAHVMLDYQGRVRVVDAVPAALDHGVGDPDARHDVHALGQLFESVVGGGRIARVEMGRFAPIVAQALALDPNDRPPDGRALAAGLRKALGKPVKAGALASWIRDACPDRLDVWREVRTVVRGTQVPPRTLRKLARLLAPEASAAPDGARAPDYRSPPTAPELPPVRMAPSTAPPGAGPPVPPPGVGDAGPTTAPPHTVPPVPPPEGPHRTGPMPVVEPPAADDRLPLMDPPQPSGPQAAMDGVLLDPDAALRASGRRAPLRRPRISGKPPSRRTTAELPRPGSRPRPTPAEEQAPLVPPRVTAPVPSPGEDDPTRMHQAPQRPAGFLHPARGTDEPTVQGPVVPRDDSVEPTRPQRRREVTSVSQEPTRSLPGPASASERTVDSGEFTDLLLAVRPPEADPRRYRKTPAPRGLPPDGFEPRLWGEPEPPRPPAVEHLDTILGDLASGRPTGDKASGVVVEVARVVDGVVAASKVLHHRASFPAGQPVVRHTGQAVTLCVPKGATGRRLHLGASETVPEGPCEIPLEPGDRAELRWAQATWRIRVDHAARDAGRATGRRKPWGVWLGALGAGAVLHLLFALGVVSLDAAGVKLTVDEPPPKERFASLKEARELPKLKPKPKVKKARPKPKPKPVKRRKRPDERAPTPKPADPAEATPQLPSSVRTKVRQKMARTRKRAQDDAEALMAAVNAGADAAPSADDVTLKDVASNIDAVGKAGKTGAALEVPGVSAPLPGGDVNIGRQKAPLATTGGQQIGKRVGKLGRKTTKGAGRIRGKVRNLSSRTKVSSCSLSKGQVRTAVDRNQGKVVGCYEKALLKSAALSGKLTVEWRITPAGKVRGAKVKSSSLGDPAVAECVLRVIRKTRFPSPPDGGECVIAYPFIFSPSQ